MARHLDLPKQNKKVEALKVNGKLAPAFKNADVLCVIDFSEASDEALRLGISMAQQLQAPITVLYPYRLTHLDKDNDMAQTKRNMELAANENFKRLSDDFLSHAGVSYQFRAEVGFINDRINAYHRKHKVGLIVTSKRLITNNKEAFLEMLDILQAPLLIVPQNEP